ncbi:plastidic glucose transporter 4 isoform X1 [Glycine max]|uniref:plastidic glucose transporter 4 isoform X1 n=1 Tax=Glycine max TaxID=3847 RepID=UPI0003DEAEF1|nr:plastidic glucose transporter 4 isoform X1 [Glycine max]|eukprot:XP_006603059.1 plastidic glucose transporter 4 isoform X1 [Glycine max]
MSIMSNSRSRSSWCGLWPGSFNMETELTIRGKSFGGIFGSSAKPRSLRVQPSDEDVEDLLPSNISGKPSGTVLPYVGVACLGAMLFGYHLGVVNGSLEYLAKDLGITQNTVIQGWIVSALLAGATVGSFTGGALADKFGRTRTFQLDAIPLAIGGFLCATAQSVQTMIIGRLLAGIGIGVTSAIVPLYISEISPTEIRGALGSVNQLFICIGILAALLAGLPLVGNPIWWRTMFGITVVPSVLLALGMTISPESPRWLFQQGKISEAEKAVKTLYGKERVALVMHDLTAASEGSSEPEAGWFDLFSSRYRKVVSVGATLFLLQQLAGINAVVYYSTSVFRSAGITSDVAASALVGASNVFGTIVAWRLIRDRLPTKSNLRRRQIDISDSLCPFCSIKDETASHLFFECSKIQHLWWESQSWIGTSGAYPINPRHHFLQHNIGMKGGKIYKRWKCWWVALNWSIWQQRNKVIFMNAPFNGSKLLEDALFVAWTWFRAMEENFTIHFNFWSSNLPAGFQ